MPVSKKRGRPGRGTRSSRSSTSNPNTPGMEITNDSPDTLEEGELLEQDAISEGLVNPERPVIEPIVGETGTVNQNLAGTSVPQDPTALLGQAFELFQKMTHSGVDLGTLLKNIPTNSDPTEDSRPASTPRRDVDRSSVLGSPLDNVPGTEDLPSFNKEVLSNKRRGGWGIHVPNETPEVEDEGQDSSRLDDFEDTSSVPPNDSQESSQGRQKDWYYPEDFGVIPELPWSGKLPVHSSNYVEKGLGTSSYNPYFHYTSPIFWLCSITNMSSGIVRSMDYPVSEQDLELLERYLQELTVPSKSIAPSAVQVSQTFRLKAAHSRTKDYVPPIHTRPWNATSNELPKTLQFRVLELAEKEVIAKGFVSGKVSLNNFPSKLLQESRLTPAEVTDWFYSMASHIERLHTRDRMWDMVDPMSTLDEELQRRVIAAVNLNEENYLAVMGLLIEFFGAVMRSRYNSIDLWFSDFSNMNVVLPSNVFYTVEDVDTWERSRRDLILNALLRWEVGLILRIFPQNESSSKLIYKRLLHSQVVPRSIVSKEVPNTDNCPVRLLDKVVYTCSEFADANRIVLKFFRENPTKAKAGEKRKEPTEKSEAKEANSTSTNKRSNSSSNNNNNNNNNGNNNSHRKSLNAIKTSTPNTENKKSQVKKSTFQLKVPLLTDRSSREKCAQWLIDNGLVDSHGMQVEGTKHCWRCGDVTHPTGQCTVLPQGNFNEIFKPWKFLHKVINLSFIKIFYPSNHNFFQLEKIGSGTNPLEGPYLFASVGLPDTESYIEMYVLIDSGAGANFISRKFLDFFILKLKRIFSKQLNNFNLCYNKLNKEESFLVTYSNGSKETIKNFVELKIDINDQSTILPFYLINTDAISICIGLKDASRLRLLSKIEDLELVTGSSLATEELSEQRFDTEHIFYSLEKNSDYLDEISIGKDFVNAEKLLKLVKNFKILFVNDLRTRCISKCQMEINTVPEAKLSRQKLRKFPEVMENFISLEIKRLLENGVIEPSVSPFYCGVVMVKKPDADWRMCQNFIQLNSYTIDEFHPLPYISVLLERLKDCKYFAKMDLRNGFYQISIHPAHRHKTAFIVKDGVFQFTRMPFGLKNAPSYFQKTMERILAGLIERICSIYIDDLLVYAETEEKLLANLELVFNRLAENNVSLKASKCSFGLTEINYLGHIIDKEGKRLSPERVDSVISLNTPTNFKDLRTAIGMAAAFQEYVPNYATLIKPLTERSGTKSKDLPFNWTTEMDSSWKKLKMLISKSVTLVRIKPDLPLLVRTDASVKGVGAALFQMENGVARAIAFCSQAFSDVATRWSTYEQEAYGCYFALVKWEDKLLGRKFTLESDHKNLLYIKEHSSAKVIRWRMYMQQFNFDFVHIPGKENVIADGFSRLLTMYLNKISTTPLPEYAAEAVEEGEEEDEVETEGTLLNREEAFKILRNFHNSILGHHSVAITIILAKDAGYGFKNLKIRAKEFVGECLVCQKIKRGKGSSKVARKHTYSSYPFERIIIDALGPFNIHDGMQYIFVATCAFTRFVEMAAVPDVGAVSTARFILNNLIGRYGAPKFIQTDGARTFKNELVKNLLKYHCISHFISVPYHPQTNAITERKNAEVLKHLHALILEVDDDWVEKVPLVQRILNYTVTKPLNTYPARLVFGENFLREDRAEEFLEDNGDLKTQKYYKENNDRLMNIIEASRKHQKKIFEDDIKNHNRRNPPGERKFGIGSFVLLSYPERPPHKILAPWMGPMKVVSIDKDRVKVVNLVTGKVREVHAERIKPLTGTYSEDYERFAVRDYIGMYALKSVERANNIKAGPEHATFTVTWVGYDGNTTSDYDSLKDSIIFHQFVRKHNTMKKELGKWIPKKYLDSNSKPLLEMEEEDFAICE